MKISETVKKVLRKYGYALNAVKPNTDAWARREALVSSMGISTIVDIGGHYGNYGKRLRDIGYHGTILSFEPQPAAIPFLRAAATKNPPWEVFPFALSDFEGEADFFVSLRDSSSSLHEMSMKAQAMAKAPLIEMQRVQVKTLDAVMSDRKELHGNLYVKCDAQGAEERIMIGAAKTLDYAQIVEVELSIADMYAGQWNFRSALDWFIAKGFEIYSLEAGFADPVSGRVMQIDAIFVQR